MTKNELRKKYRDWRLGLNPRDIDNKSEQIAYQFHTNIRLDEVKCLHVFLPITKFNEVNTWPLIHQVWSDYPEIQVVVSVSDFENLSMQTYSLNSDTELIISEHGIPEPVTTNRVEDTLVDMILIPFLAIDQNGYRVGYGKGFYDRFLSECKSDVQKVGIGFASQLVDEIKDVNGYDEKVSVFVNEEGVITFE